jgi:hypothetical protein
MSSNKNRLPGVAATDEKYDSDYESDEEFSSPHPAAPTSIPEKP